MKVFTIVSGLRSRTASCYFMIAYGIETFLLLNNNHRRVEKKEYEKVERYTDLAINIKILWKMKSVKIMSVVIDFSQLIDNTSLQQLFPYLFTYFF